jgi:hypothetical protein
LDNDAEHFKEELAASEHASVSVLKQLAFDSSETVRMKVAENPHTPTSLLDSLCNDSSRMVRITSKVQLLQRMSHRSA